MLYRYIYIGGLMGDIYIYIPKSNLQLMDSLPCYSMIKGQGYL